MSEQQQTIARVMVEEAPEIIDVLDEVLARFVELMTQPWLVELVRSGRWRAVCQRCQEAEALRPIRIGEVDYELCPFCELAVVGDGC